MLRSASSGKRSKWVFSRAVVRRKGPDTSSFLDILNKIPE
jgi:hypothetical protein